MKAQVSLEFIITMATAVILLVGFLYVGSEQLSRSVNDRRFMVAQDIGLTIQQELVTAQAVSDGYTRAFELPRTALNKAYTITIQNEAAVSVITVAVGSIQLSVRAPICIGTLQPGDNIIHKEAGALTCNP